MPVPQTQAREAEGLLRAAGAALDAGTGAALPLARWALAERAALATAPPAAVDAWGARLAALGASVGKAPAADAPEVQERRWLFLQLAALTARHSRPLLCAQGRSWLAVLAAYFAVCFLFLFFWR